MAIAVVMLTKFRYFLGGVAVLFVAGCLLAIIFLSWRPSPHISEVVWLPAGLAEWMDSPDWQDIRTGIPFALLGGICGFKRMSGREILTAVVCLMLFVVIVECVQLIVPRRTASIIDVAWGWVGIVGGVFAGIAARGAVCAILRP